MNTWKFIAIISIFATIATIAAPVKRTGKAVTRDVVETNTTGFTQFETTNAVVVSAQSEKVYNKYWMSKLLVNAADPAGKSTLIAEFVLARDITNELGMIVGKELMPGAKPKRLIINDVFLKASSDVNFAIAMESVFRTLKESAIAAQILN